MTTTLPEWYDNFLSVKSPRVEEGASGEEAKPGKGPSAGAGVLWSAEACGISAAEVPIGEEDAAAVHRV